MEYEDFNSNDWKNIAYSIKHFIAPLRNDICYKIDQGHASLSLTCSSLR